MNYTLTWLQLHSPSIDEGIIKELLQLKVTITENNGIYSAHCLIGSRINVGYCYHSYVGSKWSNEGADTVKGIVDYSMKICREY